MGQRSPVTRTTWGARTVALRRCGVPARGVARPAHHTSTPDVINASSATPFCELAHFSIESAELSDPFGVEYRVILVEEPPQGADLDRNAGKPESRRAVRRPPQGADHRGVS